MKSTHEEEKQWIWKCRRDGREEDQCARKGNNGRGSVRETEEGKIKVKVEGLYQ